MAVYNGSEFLKEQLTSILRQIKKSDEVVIVNDASRDHSWQVIEKIGDKRIRLFHNPVNLGLIRSFERAIALADGDILFLSDQDDVWLKGKVSKTLEVFKRFKPLVVVSDAVLVDAQKKVIEKSFFSMRNSGPGVFKNIYKNTYIGACMAFDSKVKEWILPFPKTITMHDEWVGVTCNFVGKVFFFKEPLIYYRRHLGTVTKERRLKMNKVVLNRIKFLMAFFQRSLKLLKWRWKTHQA